MKTIALFILLAAAVGCATRLNNVDTQLEQLRLQNCTEAYALLSDAGDSVNISRARGDVKSCIDGTLGVMKHAGVAVPDAGAKP